MAAAPRGGQSKGLLPPEVPGCCQSALHPFDLEVFASPQALKLLPPLHSKAHKCPIWLRVYMLSIYLCTHTHNTQRFIRVFRAVQDTFQDEIPAGAGAKNISSPGIRCPLCLCTH